MLTHFESSGIDAPAVRSLSLKTASSRGRDDRHHVRIIAIANDVPDRFPKLIGLLVK